MSERSHSRTPPPDRRPARGIRGGKAARRKREAYLRHQEAQGFDRRSVGIIHTGGLSRPLYTPCTWEPESTTDEEGETAVFVDPEGLQQNLVDIVDLEAPAPLLPLSRPTPETVLLKARPKGPKQPDYPPPAKPAGPKQPSYPPPPKPAGPKQPNYPPPAVKGSLGVRPSSSSSATSSIPKPSAAPKVVIRPAVPKAAAPKVVIRPTVPKVAVPKVAVSKAAAPVVDPTTTAPKTPPKRAPVIDLVLKGHPRRLQYLSDPSFRSANSF